MSNNQPQTQLDVQSTNSRGDELQKKYETLMQEINENAEQKARAELNTLREENTELKKQLAVMDGKLEAKMVKRAEIDDMLNRLANMENSI